MAEPIIDANGIGVMYNEGKQSEVHALRRVDLKIYPREYIIIFGPSGCGKSTLLYSLAGLQTPSYGEVLVKGRNLAAMSARDKSHFRLFEIGMVFQAFYLVPTLSVIDNVCLPRIFEGEDRKGQFESGMQLLQRFGISEQSKKYPSELSGGQQQRVAISRALINDPDIILADEPIGNLDSESAKNVMNILKELNEVDQKTIILVTHNPNHLSLANRVIKMKDGAVVEEVVNARDQETGEVKGTVIQQGNQRMVTEDVADILEEMHKTPMELRMLMRTFRGLNEAQSNVLLVPFKAKQLLHHLLNDFTEEQLDTAERYIKEMLFGNINTKELRRKLDLSYEQGGAGWNKRKVKSTVEHIERIMRCVHLLSREPEGAVEEVGKYLNDTFKLQLEADADDPDFFRLMSVLRMRVTNKVDRLGLIEWLDVPYAKGGMGMRKDVAEKVARAVEMLMLLKYS